MSVFGRGAGSRSRPIAEVEQIEHVATMRGRQMIAMMVASTMLSTSAAPAATSLATTDVRCSGSVKGYQPAKGLVGDRSVALKIAGIYLSAIYGAEIEDEKPLKVSVRDGVWHVEGTIRPGWKGGVAEIEICQTTGRVLSVRHGK